MNIPYEMLGAGIGTLLLLGFVVGFALGLWFGERGRRIDAQRMKGYRSSGAPRAKVSAPGEYATEGRDREIMEPDESFIVQTMQETGCSREEAIKEWRTILGKALGDGGGSGWMQEGPIG